MERQEIKTKLQSYVRLYRERQHIEAMLQRLEDNLGTRGVQTDGMPHGSGKSDPTSDKALAIVDLRERYEAMTEDLARECLAIEDLIKGLDPTERKLARLRYIEGLTWEEVCVEMNYSWKQVHRIHSRILNTLEKTT